VRFDFFAGGSANARRQYGSSRPRITFGWSQDWLYMAAVMAISAGHEMAIPQRSATHTAPTCLLHSMPITRSATMGRRLDAGDAGRPKATVRIGLTGRWRGWSSPCRWRSTAFPSPTDVLAAAAGTLVLIDPAVFPLDHRLASERRPPPVWFSREHRTYNAAWFGVLLTGINMAPVSQLDGGPRRTPCSRPRTSRFVRPALFFVRSWR